MSETLLTADLLNFPYFFSPPHEGKKVMLQEKIMSFFAPSIKEIIDGYFKVSESKFPNSLDIIALGSCHTATSRLDYRFFDYLREMSDDFSEFASQFYSHYEFKENSEQGLVHITKKEDGRKLTIIHAQKVRAYDGKTPFDINILGINSIITPTRSVEKTLGEVKEKNGIALLCDPLSDEFIENSIKVVREGLADGVCFSSYGRIQEIDNITKELRNKGVPVVPVSGSHGYDTAGTSYIRFKHEEEKDITIPELKEIIKENKFYPVSDHVPIWKRIKNRDIHIGLSMFFHKSAGGKRKEEYEALLDSRGKTHN